MIITPMHLDAGMRWWKRAGWEGDFLNLEYGAIYGSRSEGLTANWWEKTVDRLWKWGAIRSPIGPNNTKESIRIAGNAQFTELSEAFRKIRMASRRQEPLIADLEWEQISDLFWLAHQMKNGDNSHASPVFASKLCHFTFPRLFPVMDNTGTGIWEFEFFWRGMKEEWLRFQHKKDAIQVLRREIEISSPPHALYPFETKIIELCQIGSYNWSDETPLAAEELTESVRTELLGGAV
jgi:hypothetical protein